MQGVKLAKQPDIPLQWADAPEFTLLLSSDVDDAEGLGRQRMTNEMEKSAEKSATRIPLALSHCGVPTLEKCGSMCEV